MNTLKSALASTPLGQIFSANLNNALSTKMLKVEDAMTLLTALSPLYREESEPLPTDDTGYEEAALHMALERVCENNNEPCQHAFKAITTSAIKIAAGPLYHVTELRNIERLAKDTAKAHLQLTGKAPYLAIGSRVSHQSNIGRITTIAVTDSLKAYLGNPDTRLWLTDDEQIWTLNDNPNGDDLSGSPEAVSLAIPAARIGTLDYKYLGATKRSTNNGASDHQKFARFLLGDSNIAHTLQALAKMEKFKGSVKSVMDQAIAQSGITTTIENRDNQPIVIETLTNEINHLLNRLNSDDSAILEHTRLMQLLQEQLLVDCEVYAEQWCQGQDHGELKRLLAGEFTLMEKITLADYKADWLARMIKLQKDPDDFPEDKLNRNAWILAKIKLINKKLPTQQRLVFITNTSIIIDAAEIAEVEGDGGDDGETGLFSDYYIRRPKQFLSQMYNALFHGLRHNNDVATIDQLVNCF